MSVLGKLFRKEVKVVAQVTALQADKSLENKKIIVTGGNRGLGLAIARAAAGKGADVLIAARNEEELKNRAQEIGCKYCMLDLCDIQSFDSFISTASGLLGGLDCLVNNAGVSLHEADYDQVTPESFDIQVNTNIKGGFFLTRSFVNYLRQNGRKGNVLFISSETGETPDIRPYGWTKAAVNSMVQGMAYRLAPEGICATDMTGMSESNLARNDSPVGRVYLPMEMAEIAAFLLSDVSGSISGQIITCNNGKTINARWR